MDNTTLCRLTLEQKNLLELMKANSMHKSVAETLDFILQDRERLLLENTDLKDRLTNGKFKSYLKANV